MDSDTELAAAAIIVAIISKKKERRRRRTTWVKPWLQRRSQLGMYDTLLREFREEDIDEYQKFLRMRPETFNELLALVQHDITKQDTVMRESIPPKIKLAATIRFLSTGASYADLQYQFRIHKSTLSRIVPEVCEAVYKQLKDNFLKVRIIFNVSKIIIILKSTKTRCW